MVKNIKDSIYHIMMFIAIMKYITLTVLSSVLGYYFHEYKIDKKKSVKLKNVEREKQNRSHVAKSLIREISKSTECSPHIRKKAIQVLLIMKGKKLID